LGSRASDYFDRKRCQRDDSHRLPKIRAEVPTRAANRSIEPCDLFDVNVWIDYPNQVDRFYGGYGPGLYFYVEASDIARFARELQSELDGLGSYFADRK